VDRSPKENDQVKKDFEGAGGAWEAVLLRNIRRVREGGVVASEIRRRGRFRWRFIALAGWI